MTKQTLKTLICNDSAEFGIKLASYLSQNGIYAYTRKNEEATIVKSIITDSPDLVIVDLTLSDSDAVQLMTKVKSLVQKVPQFLIISEINNSFIEKQLIECGASYTIAKPFGFEDIFNIIKLASVKNVSDECDDAELIVTNLIRSLGIPAHVKGYRYIRTAILESAKDRNCLESMTKELYPRVASIYETTPARVERAIRHSIETAWNRNNKEAMSKFFGCSVENFVSRPTNSEFIALASDKLELHLKKIRNNSRSLYNDALLSGQESIL